MAKHIEGVSRSQVSLFADRLEDYVPADSVVRVLDAYVDRVDVCGLGFVRGRPAATGRPGYAPGTMVKLFLYGYLHGVRSSRRLEAECGRNAHVMWLLGKLAPDFKTVATFRQENGAALVSVCAGFVTFCRKQGLLVGKEVAVDGTKMRAAASRRRVATRKGVADDLEATRQKMASYLAALDEADKAEDAAPDAQEEASRVKAALAALQGKETRLEALAGEIAASGRDSLVVGEPEARPMRIGGRSVGPAYNAQIAVSTDTHLIVHHEVTQDANDRHQLEPMALGAHHALGLDAVPPAADGTPSLRVLADTGYSHGEQAQACETAGIEPCVPPQRAVNTQGLFGRDAFTYDAEDDSFICRAGQRLRRKRRTGSNKLDTYSATDCRGCPFKPQCTKAERRTVTRSWFEDTLQRMERRVEADPGLMGRRRCTAEHPFGTLKAGDAGRFLTRGLDKVRTEFSLSVLAYNFRRAFALLGAGAFLAALA
jgi:transposase